MEPSEEADSLWYFNTAKPKTDIHEEDASGQKDKFSSEYDSLETHIRTANSCFSITQVQDWESSDSSETNSLDEIFTSSDTGPYLKSVTENHFIIRSGRNFDNQFLDETLNQNRSGSNSESDTDSYLNDAESVSGAKPDEQDRFDDQIPDLTDCGVHGTTDKRTDPEASSEEGCKTTALCSTNDKGDGDSLKSESTSSEKPATFTTEKHSELPIPVGVLDTVNKQLDDSDILCEEPGLLSAAEPFESPILRKFPGSRLSSSFPSRHPLWPSPQPAPFSSVSPKAYSSTYPSHETEVYTRHDDVHISQSKLVTENGRQDPSRGSLQQHVALDHDTTLNKGSCETNPATKQPPLDPTDENQNSSKTAETLNLVRRLRRRQEKEDNDGLADRCESNLMRKLCPPEGADRPEAKHMHQIAYLLSRGYIQDSKTQRKNMNNHPQQSSYHQNSANNKIGVLDVDKEVDEMTPWCGFPSRKQHAPKGKSCGHESVDEQERASKCSRKHTMKFDISIVLLTRK
ncbi:hypothetical protein BaRGS_00028549 [Batillaria attramentaria]|uniref:Uncharacterized protein n=1 Tax=Batillaria attramentaria TaxID=370345 RepID=A0ABD0JZL5_9CAEN